MHKRSLLVSVLLSWICLSAGAQQNLVSNPGFEGAAKAGELPGGGWWLYQGQGETDLRLDQTVAHTGRASARLHAAVPSKCVLVSAPFAVVPGDTVRIEAWVRGENLKPGLEGAYAGLAFRKADNQVFQHANFPVEWVSGNWKPVSGVTTVPEGAASAEVHLGYTNAPGTLWYDDVSAVITNPLSFGLLKGAQPWTGPQTLAFLLVNRTTNPFQGSISMRISGHTNLVPVTVQSGATNRVNVPINIEGNGLHPYKFVLRDSEGVQIRVLHGKFHSEPPLVLYPACPCYHAAGEGDGNTRIDAQVNINPLQRAGLRLSVDVLDAGRNRVQSASIETSGGYIVGLNVRVPVEKPAAFSIAARLVDRTGNEIGNASTDVNVCPPSEAKVTVESDGFLRVAGERTFPIGLYSSGREQEMGKAGFTATHNYGITTGEPGDAINPNDAHVKELLDRAMANGMRMMVELPRRPIETAQWEQVRRRIQTFRFHPGLLCWGSEERVARGLAPLTNIATLYELVHQLDPNHPLVLGDTRTVVSKLQTDRRDFFPDACMDIGIWWWYPIPLKGPDGNGLNDKRKAPGMLEPPSWLTTTLSKRPLWIAIQAYQQPRKDAPFPTPTEYRCLAYLSIINGVKGLWFYTGSGQRDYQGKPAGLLNKPAEAHWDYVQKLVRELRTLSPVIMAPACAAKLSLSPAGAPVEYALRDLEGVLYLLAANKSVQPQNVRFSGSALSGKSPQVLYETHPAVIQGDSLADDFAPLAVHVYKLE